MKSKSSSSDNHFLINLQKDKDTKSLYVIIHAESYYKKNSDVGPEKRKDDSWYVANVSFDTLLKFFQEKLFKLQETSADKWDYRGTPPHYNKAKIDISYAITDIEKVKGVSFVVKDRDYCAADKPACSAHSFVEEVINKEYKKLSCVDSTQ